MIDPRHSRRTVSLLWGFFFGIFFFGVGRVWDVVEGVYLGMECPDYLSAIVYKKYLMVFILCIYLQHEQRKINKEKH